MDGDYTMAGNAGSPMKAPILQSFPEYIEHHFLDELTDEIVALVQSGSIEDLDNSEGKRLIADPRSVKLVRTDLWRVDRTHLLADFKALVKVGEAKENAIPIFHSQTIRFSAEFELDHGIRFISGIKDASSTLVSDRQLTKLSKYLVPILTYEEMELETQNMLRSYLGEQALHDYQEGSAKLLAEAMGLQIMELSLYKMVYTESILFQKAGTLKILAQCPFADEDYELIDVPEKTIVININRDRFGDTDKTIFHECTHYEWHSMFFELQELHCSDLKLLEYEEADKSSKPREKDLRYLEKQACFASIAAILPRPVISPLIWKYWTPVANSPKNLGWKIEKVIGGIASEKQKSKALVRTRMICMGQVGAKGAYNYVDGRYIAPFAFNPDNLHSGETFVISRKQFIDIYANDEEFRELIDTHQFIFADGHICANQPAFVKKIGKMMVLTDWANGHVDECCLKFKRSFSGAVYSDYRIGQLHSDCDYNACYVMIHSMEIAGLSPDELNAKNEEYLECFPRTPMKALQMLIQDRCKSQRELSYRSGLSETMISRMCRDKNFRFSIQDVTRLVVGLSLPPALSSLLLETIGFTRSVMVKYYRYQCIMDCMFMDDIEDIVNAYKDLFE